MEQQAALQTDRAIQPMTPNEEGQVIVRLEKFSEAVRNGDLNEIMSFYAADVVAFDMMPPLVFTNKEEYKKKAWEEYFTEVFQFPISFSLIDQKIITSGDVAISFGLVHVSGTFKKNGETVDNWIRNTTTFRKINGAWLIINEHHSVPVGTDGSALMGLKPEKSYTH